MNETKYDFEIVVSFVPKVDVSSDEIFDAIADAFFDCTGVEDHDVSAHAVEGTLTFSMSVTAEDVAKAFTTAVAAVRTAVHCAGHSTPGWEDMTRVVSSQMHASEDRELIAR